MEKMLVALDIETKDELLKTKGWSWKYNQGYILCTSLSYYNGETKVIAGMKNENTPYNRETRREQNKEVYRLLRNENVIILGANIQYDLGWLLYEYNMQTFDVKCTFIDILQAERILDEFTFHSLESLAQKYLKTGKTKDRCEEWVFANIPKAKGDFRKYLSEVPYDLLCEYVRGDTELPLKIWECQLKELSKQNLVERAKLEFDCILPILQITKNGFPFDNEQRKKNLKLLTGFRDSLAQEFAEKLHKYDFNVNSSNHIAKLCDEQGIPYNCKITLKGKNGKKFANYKETDSACAEAERYVNGFRFVKSIPVCYIDSKRAPRAVEILEKAGFMLTCSPNVDKKFFANNREKYPLIAEIADWKSCNSILSKILCDEYADDICSDGKMRPQFNITDTVSFRLSSNHKNLQQVVSKGSITVNGNEIQFAPLTRALFKPNAGEVFWKIDYGQIEYRLICNIAVGEGSKEVREEYARNPELDFHQYVVDLTGLSRKLAKNMSFGVSFGMGLKSMAENFGWDMDRATEISDKYHEHMPFVAPTLKKIGEVAKQRGFIYTVLKSHARLPNKNKEYTALNRYTQGSASEILKSAIIQAYKEGLWQRIGVVNTVHDEIDGSVYPTMQSIQDVYQMSKIMCSCVKLNVPLLADVELGFDWYHVKTVKEWLELKEQNEAEYEALPEELKKAIEYAQIIERGI